MKKIVLLGLILVNFSFFGCSTTVEKESINQPSKYIQQYHSAQDQKEL